MKTSQRVAAVFHINDKAFQIFRFYSFFYNFFYNLLRHFLFKLTSLNWRCIGTEQHLHLANSLQWGQVPTGLDDGHLKQKEFSKIKTLSELSLQKVRKEHPGEHAWAP